MRTVALSLGGGGRFIAHAGLGLLPALLDLVAHSLFVRAVRAWAVAAVPHGRQLHVLHQWLLFSRLRQVPPCRRSAEAEAAGKDQDSDHGHGDDDPRVLVV